MADKVISLHGGLTGEKKPSPGAIRALEEALERARSGEVVGVALCELHCDGTASWQAGGIVGGYTLIGSVNSVLHHLLRADAELAENV